MHTHTHTDHIYIASGYGTNYVSRVALDTFEVAYPTFIYTGCDPSKGAQYDGYFYFNCWDNSGVAVVDLKNWQLFQPTLILSNPGYSSSQVRRWLSVLI